MKCRLIPGLVLGIGMLLLQPGARAAPHTFYEDGGLINWKIKIAEALYAAKVNNRPLFIHICKEDHKPSEEQTDKLFKDEKLAKLLNRHCYPMVIESSKSPPELARAFEIKKVFDNFLGGRDNVPGILMIPGQSQTYLQQFTGNGWTSKSMEDRVLNVLQTNHKMNNALENQLNKLVTALEKNLENKKTWPTATKLYAQILNQPGYAIVRDLAFDAMEKTTADGTQELKEAYKHGSQDEWEEAKKLTLKVQTDFKGLPIADEAKMHQAALKLLETANKQAADPKMKTTALKTLDQLLNFYSETPYSALAIARKKDLAPPAKK